jgi:hypothetical protein
MVIWLRCIHFKELNCRFHGGLRLRLGEIFTACVRASP